MLNKANNTQNQRFKANNTKVKDQTTEELKSKLAELKLYNS